MELHIFVTLISFIFTGAFILVLFQILRKTEIKPDEDTSQPIVINKSYKTKTDVTDLPINEEKIRTQIKSIQETIKSPFYSNLKATPILQKNSLSLTVPTEKNGAKNKNNGVDDISDALKQSLINDIQNGNFKLTPPKKGVTVCIGGKDFMLTRSEEQKKVEQQQVLEDNKVNYREPVPTLTTALEHEDLMSQERKIIEDIRKRKGLPSPNGNGDEN